LSKFSKTAGPGILFASAAISVSHLVQSTRAGADFGLLLARSLIVVLQFAENLKEIVDFAIVLSFMIAPVIAVTNFRLVTGKFLEKICNLRS
jgi:Mn2+/Fe2+ NRAMP family transporter